MKITNEYKEFLKSYNNSGISFTEIYKQFLNKFNIEIPKKNLSVWFYQILKCTTGYKPFRYTEEHKNYLKYTDFENKPLYKIREDFEEHFNIKVAPYGFETFFYDLGLRTNNQNNYTEEEYEYIKTHIYSFRKHGYFDEDAFIEDFNSKFEHKISHDKLNGLRHRLNIKLGKQDYNEYKKYLDYSKHPIGAEVIRKGDVYVKVNHIVDPNLDVNELWKLNWKCKARLLYEQYHDVALSSDDVVIFLNKDKLDFSKENLVCINRKIQGHLINFQHIDNIELRKTALQICQIKEKLSQLGE